MTSPNKAKIVAKNKTVLRDGSRKSRSDTNGTDDLQARQLVISAHLAFRHANIRPAEGGVRLSCCPRAHVSDAYLIKPSVVERVCVGERENSKARIAGTRKPRDIASRVQPVAGKCDSLLVLSEEEAGGELAVWANDVVKVA